MAGDLPANWKQATDALIAATNEKAEGIATVSYTHLDVYKRQVQESRTVQVVTAMFAFPYCA